jgi:hypothetical protein
MHDVSWVGVRVGLGPVAGKGGVGGAAPAKAQGGPSVRGWPRELISLVSSSSLHYLF